MSFSSGMFVFVFLPAVVLVYYLLSMINQPWTRKAQLLFLTIASLVFYGYYNVQYIYIIGASMLVNYFCAFLLQAKNKKRSLFFLFGILFNVALLGYFKYFDFVRETFNQIAGTTFDYLNLLLPLGISFFTFQQMVFLVHVYKGKVQRPSFINYALFVLFFPQLVAGPIVTYEEMMPQFAKPSSGRLNADNISRGIYLFVIGLAKKVIIADTLALFVDNGYGLASYGFSAAWITTLAYSMQIYFDFSGYSDMAMGIGYMFNVRLPVNFNSPYKSASVREYWTRWHITLGRTLTTLVYIPLGGNRKGKGRTCFNILVVFFVSGLWHGAAWTFVVWGLLHGIALVFERIFEKPLEKVPHALRVACTFFYIHLTRVLFRAPTFGKAMDVLRGLVAFGSLRLTQVNSIVYDGIFTYPLAINLVYVCGMLLILGVLVFVPRNSVERLDTFRPTPGRALSLCALFGICTIHISRLSTFIYFNF